MKSLSDIGRIFYSIAIAELGLQTIYYNDFPYFLLPPNHPQITGLTYTFGALLVLAALFIAFEKKAKQASLITGTVLLLIFCFWFIPYQFIVSSNYMRPGDWENAEKELALSGGAFAIAASYTSKNEGNFFRFLGRIARTGPFLFAVTIFSFGILHFLHAKEASTLVPSWIPDHTFWIYFAGVALLGSGIAIMLKIKTRLFATLLGVMILIWFIILHVPRVMVAPSADLSGEISSAFLALAYSGIAFVIAAL